MKKEIVNNQIKSVVFEQGEVFRRMIIESKKFGTLPYYFEYLNKGGKVILFRTRIKENGNKIRIKERYVGRTYKSKKGVV